MEESKGGMGMMKAILFWRNGCPICIPAKARASSYSNVNIININTEPTYVNQYKLKAVPTLVLDFGDTIELFTTLRDIYDALDRVGRV